MFIYMIINAVMLIIGCIAVGYLLFHIFSWYQGDAIFYIEAKKRTPFQIKQSNRQSITVEAIVPFKNIGKQPGTIMDFYPRILLPQEQFNRCYVCARLTNVAKPREDSYWESTIFYPKQKNKIKVIITLSSKTGSIQEDIQQFPDMPIDLVYQAVGRNEWYIHKARITLRSAELCSRKTVI